MTEQERAAASAENYRRMRSELDRRLSLDPELRSLSKKIRGGKADFNDTFRYSEIVSKHLGEIMQENIGTITNPLGKEYVCKALLQDHYDAINDVLGEVQVALDEELGIHLNPVKAPRNDERIAQVAHALEDPTVKPETIRRRAKAPVVNTAMSMHDDYIKTNAKLRNDLGLKPILQRYGSGCCSWCSAVTGKWRFGEQPEDVFRRHDNCNCTIIYDTQVLRGAKTDSGRSKTWEEVDPGEVMAQGFQPTVNTPDAARKLQENAVSGLTLSGKRDIMRVSGAVSGALNPYGEQADEHAKRYYAAVRKMTTDVRRISENTGYPEELVQSIKDFVFNEKHDLGDRVDYFDPDYKMAQSWQRLIDGKDIQPHDLTLLKHEQMERTLMQQGYSQSEAHSITSQKYNYSKEAKEYYDRFEKHNKE